MPALLSLSLWFSFSFHFFGCCIFLADQTNTLPAAASATAPPIGRSGGVSVACRGRWEEKSREGIKCWRKLVKKNLVHLLLLLEQQTENKIKNKKKTKKTKKQNRSRKYPLHVVVLETLLPASTGYTPNWFSDCILLGHVYSQLAWLPASQLSTAQLSEQSIAEQAPRSFAKLYLAENKIESYAPMAAQKNK